MVGIGIVMGSNSDWPVMNGALDALMDLFDLEHVRSNELEDENGFRVELNDVFVEVKVVSAHRTPEELGEYARTARERGLKVIIAGAGGAAHLPGMLAAQTTIPVIGVPVNITALNGTDSLLSIVQMPKGIPVATVAIDGAYNAGLLAAQIFSVSDNTSKNFTDALEKDRRNMKSTVRSKGAKLRTEYESKR